MKRITNLLKGRKEDMDILNNYETQMENLLDENAATISRCETRIEELKAEIETAGADMVTATSTVDTEAYKNAKNRKDDAELELGMLQSSLKKLKENPLVSADEFREILSGLIAEQTKFTDEFKQRYASTISAMIAEMNAAEELDGRIEKDILKLRSKVARLSSSQPLPEDMEEYRHSSAYLDEHPVIWFLENLKVGAEHIGIE